MDFKDILKNRRSVRFFKPDKIEQNKIDEIIASAVQAPTAMNSQPWAFKIIDDADTITAISTEAKSHMLSILADDPHLNSYKEKFEDEKHNIFYNAPLLVIVYSNNPSPGAAIDCAMAAYTAMLTATDLGLGSCWIGLAHPYLMTDAAIKKYDLPAPSEYTVVAPLAIGYSKFPISKLPAAEKSTPIIL